MEDFVSMKLALLAVVLVFVVGGALAFAGKGGHGPDAVEWGRVAWLRDYDEAVDAARKSTKPIFLLFQEVPG